MVCVGQFGPSDTMIDKACSTVRRRCRSLVNFLDWNPHRRTHLLRWVSVSSEGLFSLGCFLVVSISTVDWRERLELVCIERDYKLYTLTYLVMDTCLINWDKFQLSADLRVGVLSTCTPAGRQWEWLQAGQEVFELDCSWMTVVERWHLSGQHCPHFDYHVRCRRQTNLQALWCCHDCLKPKRHKHGTKFIVSHCVQQRAQTS